MRTAGCGSPARYPVAWPCTGVFDPNVTRDALEGAPVSRRDALRIGAVGLSGLLTPVVGWGCGGGSEPATSARARSGPAGSPALKPFDAGRPAGPRTGLPRRVAWANTTDSEDFAALGKGMQSAARERDLEYLTAIAFGDPARNVDQIETFLARGLGGLLVQPLDQTAQRPAMARALESGVCVQGIITHPSVLQIAADQYEIGFTQGKAAADHARSQLGGKAEVHYFNSDSLSPQLRLRHRGVLDGLRTGGDGIEVVSDIPPGERSIEGGFATMNTVIQRHPGIKIVLGSDTFVAGAYRALEQSGRLTEDMYLGGVDGDANALSLIKQGGPYRASLGFAWQLMGYGMGQFAADWVEGKEIPRVVVAKAVLIDSPARVDSYLAANKDPAPVFADREHYEQYLPLLGNVGYATRRMVWREEYSPR